MGTIIHLCENDRIPYDYVSILRISIKHQNIDPQTISNKLSMDPDFSWKNGDQIITPNGKIREGFRVGSYWTKSSKAYKKRDFFSPLADLIEILYAKKSFLKSLLSDGGKIEIIVELKGSVNTGDYLNHDVMSKILDMGLILGIEVFPEIEISYEDG